MGKQKTIYLLRHGDAEFRSDIEDFDRSLTELGTQQISQAAKQLIENHIKIDLIISSNAQRAAQSSEIVRKHLHLPEVDYRNSLYPCTSNSIFDTLVSIDDNINSVILVGHNPGLSSFAQEYMQLNSDVLPTAGLISCTFSTASWAEFAICEARRNFLISPKQ